MWEIGPEGVGVGVWGVSAMVIEQQGLGCRIELPCWCGVPAGGRSHFTTAHMQNCEPVWVKGGKSKAALKAHATSIA